ncbi:MAG: endonuclease/exonuclease/phosphatase family protein [Hyphomicrobiaceae bacterium]|nr:endonuclease/exonuclease/phosphatase family protein [Hyphomicrobiaceae bacterium]
MRDFREKLDQIVSPKRDTSRNLLIGTWNLKAFASLTERWTARSEDSPKRDWRGLWAITEIISRFDVIALQEAKGDLKALRSLLKTLGRDWQFLMTDVTRGDAGNGERLAFLFDARRVSLSGLACELVVPDEQLQNIAPDALQRQFVRTPYAVGFKSGSETFVLVTMHVIYGDKPKERYPEIKAIADWMSEWALQTTEWEQNLILLGDFNIDRHGSDLWQAFASSGLTIPSFLDDVPRSIFASKAHSREKYYDQIAWFETTSDDRRLNMNILNGGYIEFVDQFYTDLNLTKSQLQHRISDHYPLWVEFECRE